MADRPADELIGASGDLRRLVPNVQKVVPERAEELVPTFDRLLGVVLDHDGGVVEQIDYAGMYAIDSLVELKRADVVVAQGGRLARRGELAETQAAAARIRAGSNK